MVQPQRLKCRLKSMVQVEAQDNPWNNSCNCQFQVAEQVNSHLIHFGIGDKWLPMLDTFRVLLVFALLSPIKETTANLFIAVGKPKYLVKTRIIQFGILVIMVLFLGPIFGIIGIGIAADLMVIFGIIMMLVEAKKYVDISVKKLFLVPMVGLLLGNLLTWIAMLFTTTLMSDLLVGIIKIVTFSISYILILTLLEFDQIKKIYLMLMNQLFSKKIDST